VSSGSRSPTRKPKHIRKTKAKKTKADQENQSQENRSTSGKPKPLIAKEKPPIKGAYLLKEGRKLGY
jgi:hypothetical protein